MTKQKIQYVVPAHWEILGGRAPFGKSFEDGLKEKIKEYLGVEIEIVNKIIGNEKIKINREKLGAYKWFSYEECKELFEQGKLAPGDFEFIEIAFKKKPKIFK